MRDLHVALFLAFKSIVRGHKFTIALMVLVLSLSFINLMFLPGILNGVTTTIQSQIINNYTGHIVIEPQEEPTKKDFIIHQEELRNEIQQIPGVMTTVRHYKLPGTLAYDKEKNGKPKLVSGEIVGIDPEQEKKMTLIAKNMVDGEYLEEQAGDEIILGSDIAGGYGGSQELTSLGGVKLGEKIKATFSNGVEREYTVKGIYKVRFGFVDRMAFITSKEAESVLSTYGNASQILIKVDTAKKPESTYIKRVQSLAPNLKVRTWEDLTGEFANITKSFNMINLVVRAVILVVAATTIFILIYVNAVNKRRQIGILKAIGINQNIIIVSYVFQSLFYTVCGIALGTALTFYGLVPFFLSHPLKMPIGDTSLAIETFIVTSSVLSLTLAGLAAGFIPSRQVAKENILKAIWGT